MGSTPYQKEGSQRTAREHPGARLSTLPLMMIASAKIRHLICTAAWLTVSTIAPGFSQSNPDMQTFFREKIGLSKDQISDIRSGKAVAKALPSRVPSEVFLFGAIYIHAAPESYLQFERDFDRRRELPAFWDLVVFSNPPRLSDLKNFALDNDEIQDLKKCTPGDCRMQLPASSIEIPPVRRLVSV